LIVVITALLLFINVNVYKPRIEAAASDAMGMDFKIGGPMKIVLFPRFGVSLENVLIKKGELDFLSAQRVRIGLKLLPLIKHEVRITEFTIIEPKITIERDKNGRFNFERSIQKPAKEEKLPVALLTMGSFVISKGELVFLDRISNTKTELNSIDLNIKALSFSAERSHSLLRNVSFSGTFQCKTLKAKDFEVKNIRFDMKGKDGIFDISPITMNFFGGTEKGAIKADLRGDSPFLKIQFAATKFNFEKFVESFSRKKVMKGQMDFSLNIVTKGKSFEEMKKRMNGEASLRGENLLLYGMDLDSLLSNIEESQNFSLVDVGAFFLAGPLGTVLTKGYDFAGVYQETRGGQGMIKNLVSEWRIKNGIAEAEDVALSTKKNRVAMKGGLDFVNSRFDDVTVAALDEKGCAKFSQKIHGPFRKPQIEKISTLRTIVGPAVKLFEKAQKFVGWGKCKAFYKGSVKHPV
jgi:AsmA protein